MRMALARHLGDGSWYNVWSKDGKLIYGIRRSSHRHLELAALNPRDGTESLRMELGGCPRGAVLGDRFKRIPGARLQASRPTARLSSHRSRTENRAGGF